MAGCDPDASFEEQLRRFVRTGFQVARENPDLCRLLHVGAESVGEEMKQRLRAEENPLVSGVTAMFKNAIEKGEAEPIDPEIAVRLMSRMMASAMHECHVYGEASDADSIADAMERIMVNAFVKR